MKIRVYYEDTDAGGVVYHTKYISFCEKARSELFFERGIKFDDDGFVVRDIQATFFKPAKLGDLLEVKTIINQFKKSIVLLTQQIFRKEELLFTAKIKLVFLKNWKISPIPNKYKNILLDLNSK